MVEGATQGTDLVGRAGGRNAGLEIAFADLAGGFDQERNLTDEAQERALACLERFGQSVRDMPEGYVRAVGTNTLRRA